MLHSLLLSDVNLHTRFLNSAVTHRPNVTVLRLTLVETDSGDSHWILLLSSLGSQKLRHVVVGSFETTHEMVTEVSRPAVAGTAELLVALDANGVADISLSHPLEVVPHDRCQPL
ncbi:Uncharacterized protein Rs2_48085 [Raphanus sativus]|nr:Uncharacterized protein Rs2_48085 [Raphanus sativus]